MSGSVETIKRDSRRLRGTLLESLADPVTGALAEPDTVLLKFHGSYQQDDRDIRDERRRALLEPDYQFMIRTRTPGGVVSPEQWLKMDAIATRYGNGGLRITTRQAFQFHGVIKGELKPTLQAINAALIDTIAACGDVNRTVLVAANPEQSAVHAAVYRQAAELSDRLLPRTRAYYEIWLDEEKVADSGEEEEPLYGPTYLPRKFKTAFAVPPINDVDVFAHDLGYTAIIEDGALLGYNLSVGGGMGASHGDPETYPRLADMIGFVTPDQVIPVAEAVMTAQRDHGNRAVRKRARLKYTIDDHGIDWFTSEVERRAGFALAPARPSAFEHTGDRYGWVEGENGHWHLTLWIPAGRIIDRPQSPWLTGLREVARLGVGHFRMTANQNLLIADVPADRRAAIDALIAAHGLDAYGRVSVLARQALACVALPTCGLAMAEAERYLPDITARLDALLAQCGLSDAPILLRISGCPNGCSRPYLAEIALVGKGPGRYNLFLGADGRGQRLSRLYRENLDEAELLSALEPLLTAYAGGRNAGEGFGDFLTRTGVLDPAAASG
ncbi:MAG: sulfite reductase [Gammaproteobacteria bacterium HGW-Gammaproteobacteria-7]|nr:MAG: sulfite reductase [Gammaproteobacteria bacterium HGW-Gammaproteobacteria-7]